MSTAVTLEELKSTGYDIYNLSTLEQRNRLKKDLSNSGVEFDTQEFDEVVLGKYALYILAAKRISPTLKKRLGKFPHGD